MKFTLGNSADAISANVQQLVHEHSPEDSAAYAYALSKGQRIDRTRVPAIRRDEVPSHIVSLAKAHAIALKQRTSGGHFVKGHGLRSRIPRAMPPDAIEASFAAAIVKMLDVGRRGIASVVSDIRAMRRNDQADASPVERAPLTLRNVAGFDCVIENPAGSSRSWVDSNGTSGSTLMRWDYGYIMGTRGADGEDVDVYIGPNSRPDWVFVVHQRSKAAGFAAFDEDKVMLGWDDANAAKSAYLVQYDDPRFFGGMSMLTLDDFAAELRAVDGGRITHARADAGDDFSSSQRDRIRSALDRARKEMQSELSTGRISAIVTETASQLSTFNATQFSRQIKAAIGINASFRDPKLSDLIDAFVHENVSLIRSLGNRALDDVEKIITNSVATGDNRAGIADDIAERHGVSERHARLIARDQIGKLNGQMTRARHDEMGVSSFRWVDRGDDKVRPSHKRVSGKVYAYDNPPEIDGERVYPGQAICCRCEQEPVFDNIKAAIAASSDNAMPSFGSVSHAQRTPTSGRRRKR